MNEELTTAMKSYRVNDVFYSLQGEGHNTGRAAVFVRFAGCNLRCPFCDTEFDTYTEMTGEQIVNRIADFTPHPSPFTLHDSRLTLHDSRLTLHDSPFTPHESPLIVLTGGEPTLQVDEALVCLLHRHGYEVAMESNGTRQAPPNLDWLTVSPKTNGKGEWAVEKWLRLPDELKIVFDEQSDPDAVVRRLSLPASHVSSLISRSRLFLQPCDTGDGRRNAQIVAACVDYIKTHPQWRLSLQTHKLINIE